LKENGKPASDAGFFAGSIDGDAPLIDGAGGWTGVRMRFAPAAWRRSPPLKETKMSERLETLKKARERMIEDRDTHAKVLAAPFDRDKAERARNKFIEIQMLIDSLDRAIGGEAVGAPAG
jgi:hypothetical protein